jgi:hypothetical protein
MPQRTDPRSQPASYRATPVIDAYRDGYPLEKTVTVADTAVGSNTAFAVEVDIISVYATLDCWVAKTAAGAAAVGDGTLADHRIFVAAGERRVLFWGSTGFWVVNANGGELPKARVDGWAY